MQITISVDNALGAQAESLFETIGIDTETAIRMFLKRAVLEQRLPLNTSAITTAPAHAKNSSPTYAKRTNNTITKAMAEDIWERFIHHIDENSDINDAAAAAHNATGMNQGSAFIYLTILDNLIAGKHNTRNMKMADLEYYVSQIKKELDIQSYLNALESLKLSIPYWDKEAFGQFASKVRDFVAKLEREDHEFISDDQLLHNIGLTKGQDESFQDYVKRSFAYVVDNRYLTHDEINRLMDKSYSHRTFGLNDSFLSNERWFDDYGNSRSWANPIAGYYLCSEWNKARFNVLEPNYTAWLIKIIRNGQHGKTLT